LVKEKFTMSFDDRYMYTMLSSPRKTICTVVILENTDSGNRISHSLRYFNYRTIRRMEWGLSTNDLFVMSSDIGLAVYRQTDDEWRQFHIKIETNVDGSDVYYLYGGYGDGRVRYEEIPSDTIPAYFKNLMHSSHIYYLN
jgi:hypothetical protein